MTGPAAKRFMVTGGAGFIGSAVVRHLIRNTPHEVVVVDKLTYAGNLDSLAPVCGRRSAIASSATTSADGTSHARVVRGGASPTWSSTSPPRAMSIVPSTGRGTSSQTNIVGTFMLLEASARLSGSDLPGELRRALPLPSTSRRTRSSARSVPGSVHRDHRLTGRTRPMPRPRRPPIISSAPGTQTYGLPVVISNCSNNFGPYQFPEKLIPLMILNCLEGRPLPVYGQRRECARLALRRGSRPGARCSSPRRGRVGESYIVGGGTSAPISRW